MFIIREEKYEDFIPSDKASFKQSAYVKKYLNRFLFRIYRRDNISVYNQSLTLIWIFN